MFISPGSESGNWQLRSRQTANAKLHTRQIGAISRQQWLASPSVLHQFTRLPTSPALNSHTQNHKTMKIAPINLAAFAGIVNIYHAQNAFGVETTRSLRAGIGIKKDVHVRSSHRTYSTGSMAPPVLDANSNIGISNSNSTTIVGGKPVDYPRKYPVSEVNI